MYAKAPAKKAPTIQENNIGRPIPPKNPVVAGFTDSIDSMAGADISLKIMKAKQKNIELQEKKLAKK